MGRTDKGNWMVQSTTPDSTRKLMSELDVEPLDLMHIDEREGPIGLGDSVERSELDAVVLCHPSEADGIVDHMGAEAGTVWVSWLSEERKETRRLSQARAFVVQASNATQKRRVVSFDTHPEAMADFGEALRSTEPRWTKIVVSYLGGRVTSVERAEDMELFTDH